MGEQLSPKIPTPGGYLMTEITYRTERLDHLGIVTGICDEIGLVNLIDRLVPAPRRQVTIGQAVEAMIITGLWTKLALSAWHI
jgi:hypothetical protein